MDFSKISVLLLFIITLVCAVGSTTYRAYYIKKCLKKNSAIFLLNAGISICCAIALFILSGFDINVSKYSILIGIAFGLVTILNSIFYSLAIKNGPYGYTTVIISLSTAITALSGAIFWNEKLTTFKIVGIVLMLICFFLSVDTKDDNKKANLKWFIFCMIGLLSSASIGLIQKVHQSSEYKSELMPFLVISFIVGAIASEIYYLIIKKKDDVQEEKEVVDKKKALILLLIAFIICGIGAAGNNAINLYLSGVVDSAIFFPIVNGVPLLASLLFSFIFFKEKLKTKQLLGLLVGIIAIVFLFL